MSDIPADRLITFSVESVRSDDDEDSEESEDDDIFVPKEFVEIREGDVHTYYCIEEEVGRYTSQLQTSGGKADQSINAGNVINSEC